LYHGPAGGGAAPQIPYNQRMPNARDLAADLLLRLDKSGVWVREGLPAARAQLPSPRDRGLLTELAYGTVRRRGTLDAVLAAFSKRPVAKLNTALRVALRLALYQILFLDRVPDHAAVDHAVGWARGHAGPKRAGFVNGVLRSLLRDRQGAAVGPEDVRRDVPREDGSAARFERRLFADLETSPAANLAARYSMPRGIVERWIKAWGVERCAAVLRAGITRPPLTLRARNERSALEVVLRARDTDFEVGAGNTALVLKGGEGAIGALIDSGQAAVQDAISQRVAPLVDPRAGEHVLDLCAAPGGKTLHLADLMGSGHLVACDVDAEKVSRLESLAPGQGIDYETVQVDPKGALPFARDSFDAILVDAPCSNTGVLRRRVEARWRLQPKDFAALAAIQLGLLERSVAVLKPGGRIVYSTCSLEAVENEAVVEAFLVRHPDFEGEIAYSAWPSAASDGGFAAILRSTS